MLQPLDVDQGEMAELVGRLWPGATVVHTWTYEDGRAAFLRWMVPQVSHLQTPAERIDALIRALNRILNLSEDARVLAWAERLWNELLEVDLPGRGA